MSPMNKSITALAVTALLATVGYATAQSTEAPTDVNGVQTVNVTGSNTTTTTTTTTQVIPAPDTGVVELQSPKGTVAPTTPQANGPMGMQNSVMTTGVTNGATRPSVGDHATPPIQGADTVLAVTTERTTTTTPAAEPAPTAAPMAEPEPAPAPEPIAAPVPEAAPEPMLAPRADRN